MATKLDALLGVLKTRKENTQRMIDTYYKEVKKRPLFDGLSRVYQARSDTDTEVLPAEGVLVQHDAENMITDLATEWAKLINLVATVDVTNSHAAAPVMLGDTQLTEPLPAVTLVYLEKQLVDLHSVLKALPVQDPAKPWNWDAEREQFTSGPVITFRSKKVPRNHTRFEGNDKHAPQIDVYNEDVTIGEWSKTDFTTALTPRRKRELLERSEDVIAAVRAARSNANATEATDVRFAKAVFDHILGA